MDIDTNEDFEVAEEKLKAHKNFGSSTNWTF